MCHDALRLKAIEIAGRVWCDPDMAGVQMDVDAATAIAIVLKSVLSEHERTKDECAGEDLDQ